MILINLLPHREAARKKRRDAFFGQLGASFLVGGLIAGSVYLWYQGQIDTQMERNAFLRSEITKLDAQIKDIAGLQAELTALKSRQAAVENLQADRNLPVHLLEEMVRQLPEGVYLRTLTQQGRSVLLTGTAESQERVSELLRNLSTNSAWLTRPELVEIVAASVQLASQQSRRVSNFTIRVTQTRGPDAPADEAATPAGAGGAAARPRS
ncbi:MAG: PilN domain-containing protein [Serpentinimonas sp.]|jgi:type IV pilus assembly protein PilN|nr:PilN domain-containing protein [Serpentinimonas sp.]